MTIERHVGYKPIEGDVIGIVEDYTENEVHLRINKTVFVISMDQFMEYWEKA